MSSGFPGDLLSRAKRFTKNNNSKLIMKTYRISSFVLAMALGTAISAFAQTNFTANLTHDQETVQGSFVTSGPTPVPRPMSFGTANFTLSADMSQLSMTVTVTNIDVTGSQTPGDTNDNLGAAHIHANATVVQGQNAGVVWGFFGSPFDDDNMDVVLTPFASGVGGTFAGIWQNSEGNGTTLADQLNNIMTGHSYINFHTGQFGGGEIRGALVPEPSTIVFLAMGGLGVLYAARRARRKVE